jgi:superfamily II DNA or RNA helicase
MVPQVHLIRSEVRFPDGARIPWATRINALAFNEEYQHSVAIMAAAYAAKGHRVLVVSDRVRFLKNCAELVGDKAISVTGEIPHEQRENLMSFIKTGEKQILFGTQSIFSEGISLNELSCIILGTPINNEPLLTQLVGRVLRKQEGKLQPVIIDIQLKGKTAQKQAKNRLGFYMKQGWEIKTI